MDRIEAVLRKLFAALDCSHTAETRSRRLKHSMQNWSRSLNSKEWKDVNPPTATPVHLPSAPLTLARFSECFKVRRNQPQQTWP